MKKSTKIILPALALLCLGTAASVTGTVAWFASNGLVKATGMQVKCSTAKNLLIADYDPSGKSLATEESTLFGTGNYGTSVVSKRNGLKELSPSSTSQSQVDTCAPNFYMTNSTIDAVSGTVRAKTADADGTKIYLGSDLNQYVKHSFWLMAQSVNDLYLSIENVSFSGFDPEDATHTAQDLNDDISQALRMAVCYTDTTGATTTNDGKIGKIYQFGSQTNKAYAAFGAGEMTVVGDDVATTDTQETNFIGELTSVTYGQSNTIVTEAKIGDATVTEDTTALALKSENYAFGKIESTKESVSIDKSEWHRVDVYFWYEGQDENCTAAKALNIQEVEVEIQFRAQEGANA